MSTTIDERVVSMQFDNKHFESNVRTTMSTLDKLKQSLNLKGASKGLEDINTAAKRVDFSGMSRGIETVQAKFSYFQATVQHQLNNIVDSAVRAGKRIVSALTIDPVKSGFQEYETQINAVQTILANTQSKGTTLDDVNYALDELNAYADKTIYNFTQMTKNIGTFTAAGIDLETSVNAIQGIANLAAVSGSNAQQASTAMYQLSQALASGTVKLMDWNSVVNAGMGGQVFQDALRKTSEELKTGAEAAIEASGSFRESLRDGWLTSEVLTETLKKFTESGAVEYISEFSGIAPEAIKELQKLGDKAGYDSKEFDELAESISGGNKEMKESIVESLKFAQTATDAATKVKTFSQLIDTLKESLQSGWTQTWEILIGDFEEAKELWTSISDALGKIITNISDARNALLEKVMTSSWDKLVKKIEGAGGSVKDFEDQVRTLAKEAGVDLDELSEKTGSFGKAVQKAINDKDLDNSILSKALKNLTGSTDEASKSTENLTGKFDDYKDVVRKTIRGEFGNAEKRYKALADAGYNAAVVQELVNKVWFRSNYEWSVGCLTAKDFSEAIANLSEEELKSLGITEEQAKALGELGDEADKADSEINDLIGSMGNMGGRDLLIESFKNIGDYVSKVFETIKKSWGNVFDGVDANDIYGVIEKFHELTESMTLTEEGAQRLENILTGVFNALDISWSLASVSFMGGLKILNEILKLFGTDLGAALEWVALKITELNNIIEGTAGIGSDSKWADLAIIFVDIAKGIGDCIKAFIELEAIGTFIDWVVSKVGEFFGVVSAGAEGLSIENVSKAIQDFFANIAEWIRGIDTAEDVGQYIAQGIGRGLVAGVSFVVQGLGKMLSSLLSLIPGFDEFLNFKGVQLSLLKFELALENIKFVIDEFIAGELTFTQAFGRIKTTILKLFGINPTEFTNKLTTLIDTFKNMPIIGDIVKLVTDAIAGLRGNFDEAYQAGKDTINGIIQGLKDGSKTLGSAVMEIATMVIDFFKAVLGIQSPSTVMMTIGGFLISGLCLGLLAGKGDLLAGIKSIGDIIKNTFNEIVEKLPDIGTKLLDFVKNIDFGQIIATLISASTLLLLKKFIDVLEMFANPLSKLGGMFSSIGEAFSGLDKVFKSVAFENNTKGIKNISVSIALILGTVVALAYVIKKYEVSYTDMAIVSGFIVGFALLLTGLAIGISKLSGSASKLDVEGKKASLNIKTIAPTLIALGAALLMIAGVVKLMSGMTSEEMNQGLHGMGVVVTTLIGVLASFKLLTLKSAGSLDQAGKVLFKISLALLVMVGVIKLAAGLNRGEIERGAAFMLAIRVFTAILAKVTSKMNTSITKTKNGMRAVNDLGGMMLKMAVAMGIMVLVCKLAGTLKPDEMYKGVAFAAAFVVFVKALTLASTTTGKRKVAEISGLILSISFALMLMVGVCRMVGKLSVDEMHKGIAFVAAFGTLITIFAKSLVTGSRKKIANVAASITAFAIAIAVMAGVAVILGMIPIKNLAIGLVAVGLLTLMMRSLVKSMQGVKDIKGNLIVMTVAIVLLAAAVAALTALAITDPKSLGVATGVMVSVMASFALLIAATKYTKGIKDIWGTIATMTGVAIIMTGLLIALTAVANENPKAAIAAAGALSLVLMALMGTLVTISRIDKRKLAVGKNLISSLSAMVIVIGVIGVIMAGISQITNADSAVQSAISLSTILLAMSGVMFILSEIKMPAGDLLKNIGLLTAMVAPLAMFALVLSWIDPGDITGKESALLIIASVMGTMAILMAAVTAVVKFAGNFKDVGRGIVGLTLMVVPLATFAHAINEIPMGDISGKNDALMSIAAVMGAMTVLLLAVTAISHLFKSDLKSIAVGIGGLTAMIIPLGLFAHAINEIPMNDIAGKKDALLIVAATMAAMTVLLLAVAGVGTLITMMGGVEAIAGIVGLIGMLGVLSLFAYKIDELPDVTDKRATIIILTQTMTAMTALLLAISLIGFLAIGGIAGLIELAILLYMLKDLGEDLAKLPDVTGSKETINILMGVMVSLSSLLGYLSYIGPSAAVGVIALGGLTSLMGAIGTFAVLLGGLMSVEFLHIEDFLDKGLPMLEKLAGSIGRMVGSFIDGALTTATQSLPEIGENLSKFMVGARAFIVGCKLVDESTVSGAGYLALALLELTGAGFISGLASLLDWMPSLADLGLQLTSFALSVLPFLAICKLIDQDSVNGVTSLLDTISAITNTQLTSGIKNLVGSVFGEATSFDTFKTNLMAFGDAVVGFSEKISGNIDSAAVQAAYDAGMMMVALANSLPKSGGLWQDIIDEGDLEIFGEKIKAFGACLKDFSGVVSAADAVNLPAVEKAKDAGLKMVELAEKIPRTDGALQKILGEADLLIFGGKVEAFGACITTFSKTVSAYDAINLNGVENAKQAGLKMVELADVIPKTGMFQDIMGSKDLAAFGLSIKGFGDAMVAFSNAVMPDGEVVIREEAVAAAKSAGDMMVALNNSLPETEGLIDKFVNLFTGGSMTMEELGNNLSGFGDAIAKFGESTAEINAENFSIITTSVNLLVTIIKRLIDLDTSGIEPFKTAVGSLAETKFSSLSENLGSAEMSTAVTNANRIRTLIKSLVGIDTSGISTFISAIDQLAGANIDGVVAAFSGATDKMSTAGGSLISALINGFNSKQTDFVDAAGATVGKMLSGIRAEYENFNDVGATIAENLLSGLSSNKDDIEDVFDSAVKNAKTGVRALRTDFENAGEYLGDGLVLGAERKKRAAYDAGYTLGEKAHAGIIAALLINSPSKLGIEDGGYLGEGLVIGIEEMGKAVYEAGYGMGESSLDGLRGAIKHISEVVESDVDTQPTIRPVVDLTDVTDGANAIANLFGGRHSMRVLANTGSISAMMNARSQNGSAGDIVSAINRLRTDIDNLPRNTYNVNGITYDDGSNVANAVGALVREVIIQGRV